MVRRRSLSVAGENPLDTPITSQEQSLSTLRNNILRSTTSTPLAGVAGEASKPTPRPLPTPPTPEQVAQDRSRRASVESLISLLNLSQTPPPPSPRPNTASFFDSPPPPSSSRPNIFDSPPPKMNYQGYADSPGNGLGPNPRQAPPSPSQGIPHANGMNGATGLGGGMVGYPTPAGHQSDLNFVMAMVEELSGILRQNQQLTANVVEKVGKVRAKAQDLNLSNDEMIALAAAELNEDSKNLEKENSELRKALDKAEYNSKENWALAIHGANILADITEKMHAYKAQHESDTLAWHKNYRKQLSDERAENLHLRNHISDMQAGAARANGHLRDMRRWLTDHDIINELTVTNIALRTEKRFWKRMAMPYLPDDDSEFSDDDDLIDPEEKKRQLAQKLEKERSEKEEEGEGGSSSAGMAVS